MLRYLLILLLINTYGRSLGTPVHSPGNNGRILIGNLLSDLMKDCKNEFAHGQIAKNLKECNVTAPPFYEIEIQCLVFLEASSLLCNISTVSFPNITAEFEAKTSRKLTAGEFCAEAAHFSPLPTTYKSFISKVFQGDAACKKVCMDKDVLSGDTHFACKYYKWAMGIFQTPASTILSSNTVRNGLPVSGAETGVGKPSEIVTTSANNASKVQVKDPEMNVSESSSINVQNDQVQSHIESSSNGLTTSVLNQFTTNDSKLVKPSQPEDNQGKPKPTQTGHDEDNVDGEGNADTAFNQENPVIANTGQGGPVIANTGQAGPVISDNGQEVPVIADNGQEVPVIASNGQEGHVIPNNGQGGPVIDHPDPIAVDIGGGERDDGTDAEDDGDDMDSDLDVRNSQPVPNTQLHPIGETSQRDIMPNISEGFTEDDDHFFPFFLTVVIIVIVLYVLYHNKSKVGKMFFGLIVEGRQSGRRRNSRGHSYRRLDTLEQAMSASAPAPPSKIIY